MAKETFTLNIPISKIDEEQRIVTGIATTESLDSQGDIVDYEASKKAFSDWPGNIREMHNPIAVGKGIDIQFDDATKSVIVSGKISESSDGENAWKKVKEGILTGFSIGGKIFQVTKDKAVEGANRITDYALSELSLVDNPANPDAQLIMVKSVDGNLQRVETEISQKHDIKKSVDDALAALSCASSIAWLIMVEQADGDDVTDLKAAFDALRNFAAKEVQEGDDFSDEYDQVMLMARTAINLRKDKKMAKDADDKLEKTNVIGGEERDEEAKPVVAEDAKAAESDEESKEDKAEVVEDKEEAVETAKPDEVATEEKSDTEEKSSDASDLTKAVQSLVAKLGEQKNDDFKKISDAVSDLSTKVEKSFSSLEERIKTLEAQPIPTKSKASYIVGKSEEIDTDVQELVKRQEYLTVHPEDAKPGEFEQIFTALRKAKVGGLLSLND